MAINVKVDEDFFLDVGRTWGASSQLDMVIEECAELIQAIQHFRRRRITDVALASEIADVWIMVQQASLCVGPGLVEQEIHAKLARLKARLATYKKKHAHDVD